MTKPALFDSYSGSYVTDVLDDIEQLVEAEMRQESDSEFLRGRLSAIQEIREILSDARYGRAGPTGVTSANGKEHGNR